MVEEDVVFTVEGFFGPSERLNLAGAGPAAASDMSGTTYGETRLIGAIACQT